MRHGAGPLAGLGPVQPQPAPCMPGSGLELAPYAKIGSYNAPRAQSNMQGHAMRPMAPHGWINLATEI